MPSNPPKPNILFILTDQQRWDTLHCYGNSLDISPHLDTLARDGVRFEFAFTCQPVCGPARSCLQTGRYATETGCWRNGIGLPLDALTLPRLLCPAGYEIGYIGKWHLASTPPDINFETKAVPPEYRGGYDDFWLASDVLEFTSHGYDGHMFDSDMLRVDFPPGRYRADALTDFAVDYLRTRSRKIPFFLFLSYVEPHFQNDHRHFEGPQGSKQRFRDVPVPADLRGKDGDWREEYPDYLGCCAGLDENVGRLRSELAALGIAENTLIIYTSDHGCHFRTRNREYKRSCHESSIRVPMILLGPGFFGGHVITELASLIDLPPTVLNAAGVAPPSAMRGRPLQPLVRGEVRDWPQEVFVQISESQTGRALRTKRWKYSVSVPGQPEGTSQPTAEVYHAEYLYDLENDPHELVNSVREPDLKELRTDLAERLRKLMVAAGEKEPEILSAG
ncbi:MAG: sulfatase-like hydrolase/transferase [Candidatus Hydrogenedentes bacterium]|nr:sulfatase-like hydrolase/transferase [Candidatus Hydrogenedentota bacterium]